MTQFEVKGLHKSFGSHPVLRGVGLIAPAGSLTAILGPSGSGKTTMLRILAGFERADAGTVTIGDTLVDSPKVHVPSEKRRIGYVPQEGSLFPHLTVEANIGFGLPRHERRGSRVTELMEQVGLAGLGRRYPHQLSGGQQQRVALARALAIRPEIVLLDEPFASLDAGLRASVRGDVRRLLREAGTTSLLVTHDQDEALSTADHVAVMRHGTIAQCDAPQEIYTHPVDAEMARFIGDANLVDGMLDDDCTDTVLGRLAVEPGCRPTLRPGPVTVLVRPEQIELRSADANGHRPGRNGKGSAGLSESSGLGGHIIDYGYHGHDAVVHVQPERPAGAPAIVVRTLGGHRLPPGSAVALHAHGQVLAWPRARGGDQAPTANSSDSANGASGKTSGASGKNGASGKSGLVLAASESAGAEL
jgi:iron(III) transport system ATP-binding protein